jgi:predicted RNA-binding protein YlxR (DUF448 family)
MVQRPSSRAKPHIEGAATPKKARERRCVATGETLSEASLVRFAVGPDDVLTPDVAAKLPGRGVWVTANRESIDLARRKGGFARSLKGPVKVPEALADTVEMMLARRCLDHLGLMRRAGALAIGAAQVEGAIRGRPLLGMVEASDGAADGREKLIRLHVGVWDRPPPLVGCFSSEELGMALGRDRVIHACLLQERMALGWAAEIGRLAGFRAIVPGSWPDSWRAIGTGPSEADVASSGSADVSDETALED